MTPNPKKTYNKRNKLWQNSIKKISTELGWKFNSDCIYLLDKNFIYNSTFNTSYIENKISGNLSFKPYELDDVFWLITEMPENSKKRLGFRVQAAFNIKSTKITEYNIEIESIYNPEKELTILIKDLNKKVKNNSIKSFSSYIAYMEKNFDNRKEINNLYDEFKLVSLICAYVKTDQISKANKIIKFARENEINCGFNFEGRSFFDLARSYIRKITANNV